MSARPRLSRGDVVLIPFPFSDLSDQKLRPAVIVGRTIGPDVIVAFVTSQPGRASSRAECPLAQTDPEFARTGLRVPSRVCLDKLAMLHRSLVVRRLGQVGLHTEQAIAASLRYVFGL